MKKTEQVQFVDQFKQLEKQLENANSAHATKNHVVYDSPEHEAGRIKRLEKLVKKRI